ncbi:MAG: hypothetical protein ACTHMC_02555 [Pseudobacter sp.]|uniref:hypothetical protein n=1 Tax=Pseudobacter sp. TaxID=2045420 RepID=UPI003F8172DB
MKILLSSLLTLSLLNIHAQKRFEGTIVYRAYEASGNNVREDTDLSVEFGKPGIRLNVIKKGASSESIILNIDSAAQYELDSRLDTYRKKNFERKEKAAPLPGSIDFLGYQADVIDLSENCNNKIFGSSSRGRVIAYPAKDLFYDVPEEYASTLELSMLYKGKVLLGFTMINKIYSEGGEKYDTFEVKAISITPGAIAASRFEVPKGLTLAETYYPVVDSAYAVDSPADNYLDTAAVMVDTAIVEVTPAAPVKPAKPASGVKKKPATPKSPMRKPKQ